MIKATRVVTLDFMRLLGVLVIMLAHAGPPPWLGQLRNFGTPLLIVASALTYRAIYAEREMVARVFYLKRLQRLLMPVWIFLTLFFAVFWGLAELQGMPMRFSTEKILRSFVFFNGINFVWIFQVYLVLALLTPWALKVSRCAISQRVYFTGLAVAFAAYLAVVRWGLPEIQGASREFIKMLLLPSVAYALVYFYGMRLGAVSDRKLLIISSVSLGVAILLGTMLSMEKGAFVETQKFKYPPRLYYLAYAFFALHLILYFCRQAGGFRPMIANAVVWLSSHSLWIYLWHIMAVYLLPESLRADRELLPFFARLVYLLAFGIAFTMMQGWLVRRYISQKSWVGRKAHDWLL